MIGYFFKKYFCRGVAQRELSGSNTTLYMRCEFLRILLPFVTNYRKLVCAICVTRDF